MKKNITKLEKSRLKIEAVIESKKLESYRERAIKEINENTTFPGFRKGNATEQVILQKIGEMGLLYEMAEIAIYETYKDILKEEKIEAIGRPEISIDKIAPENDLEFSMMVTVLPEFKLPEYKKIAKEEGKKEIDKIVVTDEEVDKVVEEIKKNPENKLEINEELKNRVKHSLEHEKEHRLIEKRRLELVEELIKQTEIEVPDILVDRELERSEAQFKDDLNRLGIKIEDYLSHLKKTIEDLRKEWHEAAIKKSKLQLILNKIGEKEGLLPKEDEIAEQTKLIIETYKDADPDQARVFAETVLSNEKVFNFLEKEGGVTPHIH